MCNDLHLLHSGCDYQLRGFDGNAESFKKMSFVACTDAFVASTDAFVASTDAFVASTDAFVASTEAFVASTDAFVASTDAFSVVLVIWKLLHHTV